MAEEGNEAEPCFRTTPIRSDYDSSPNRALDTFFQLIHETNRCNVTTREDALV